jgi:hypothetical protein
MAVTFTQAYTIAVLITTPKTFIAMAHEFMFSSYMRIESLLAC